MAFVQVMEIRTSKFDEIDDIDKQWRKATEGKRTLRRSIVLRDRNDPKHYTILAFFDSYESAMKNSELPETGEFAAKMGEFLDAPISFLDGEVVEDLAD